MTIRTAWLKFALRMAGLRPLFGSKRLVIAVGAREMEPGTEWSAVLGWGTTESGVTTTTTKAAITQHRNVRL